MNKIHTNLASNNLLLFIGQPMLANQEMSKLFHIGTWSEQVEF